MEQGIKDLFRNNIDPEVMIDAIEYVEVLTDTLVDVIIDQTIKSVDVTYNDGVFEIMANYLDFRNVSIRFNTKNGYGE